MTDQSKANRFRKVPTFFLSLTAMVGKTYRLFRQDIGWMRLQRGSGDIYEAERTFEVHVLLEVDAHDRVVDWLSLLPYRTAVANAVGLEVDQVIVNYFHYGEYHPFKHPDYRDEPVLYFMQQQRPPVPISTWWRH